MCASISKVKFMCSALLAVLCALSSSAVGLQQGAAANAKARAKFDSHLAPQLSRSQPLQHHNSAGFSQPQQQPPQLQRQLNANSADIPQQLPARSPHLSRAAGSLVAHLNCNKVKGHVTLTPNAATGATTISAQISAGPANEVYQWSLHQFPVKPGAGMCTCSQLLLGLKLLDFGEMHGNLGAQQQHQPPADGSQPTVEQGANLVEFAVESPTLGLFGSESPIGKSLLLRGLKTGVVACATFLPTSRKSTYRAKLHAPISGSVTVFQSVFGAAFMSHLMYSNGTRKHSMHRFDLLAVNDDVSLYNQPLQSGGAASGQPPTSAASHNALIAQLEQREFDNELDKCRHLVASAASGNNLAEPLLRNSSYLLTLSTENYGMRGRTSLVLPQIALESFASVYVVVYSEFNVDEPIGCAPLKFVKPRTATTKFNAATVQGSVLFQQDSPFDVTLVRVNLAMPNSDAQSYGIDELPMIIRRKSDTRVCPNIREIIFNPQHVEPSSVPAEGEATSDQYAVGDLSGKYGSLAGKANEKLTVSDFNLPLFGANSIVGRALTVYSSDGLPIACSNVELTVPMTTAFATFDFGIQGQFIFRQAANDCSGDTYVYIEVSKPPSAAAAASTTGVASSARPKHLHSTDHNWHVHQAPVDSGSDHLSSTECSGAGAHFNPYSTSTNSATYARDCTPFNVLRCELGDMAGKMFTLEIPPYKMKAGQEPDIGKFFGTEIDLPLCGPASVVNRSLVVHESDFGAARIACSTIIEFRPRS